MICGIVPTQAADKTPTAKAAGGKNAKSAANASGNAAAAKPSGAVQKVDINMLDRGLQMPSTIPAGRVLFTVKNGGDLNHTCAITGGTLKNISLDVAPGKSGTMELTLTPGKYQAYCTFAGHEGKEARSSFTVQ